MTGMKKLDPKQRREVRRRNHIARDLRSGKYSQRIVAPRTKEEESERRLRRYGYLEEDDE